FGKVGIADAEIYPERGEQLDQALANMAATDEADAAAGKLAIHEPFIAGIRPRLGPGEHLPAERADVAQANQDEGQHPLGDGMGGGDVVGVDDLDAVLPGSFQVDAGAEA